MIVLNPITLPVAKMIGTMTTLIGDMRNHDTLAPSDIVNDLVDSCRIGKVDYGKGIVNNFKVGLQPVEDLTETSTAFKITKPNIEQETIQIDTYKKIPISLSEILSHDAFLNGEGINSFFNFVMSLLEDTATFYLYDICNKMYQDWTPGQTTQTIEIEQIDTTGMTGETLTATQTQNANAIAMKMRKTLNNMKIKNNKFTAKATYTDVNTGEQANVTSCLSRDNLKLVMNDKYMTEMMANSLATLYHSEKIGEMIPGDKFVLLPEDSMETKNANTIGWLHDKIKFALAEFYKVTLSIQDPSTTYTNSFLHIAFGSGVFQYAPGVKFVAKIVQQPGA